MGRKYIPAPPARTPCSYCGERYATGYDHIIPLHYSGARTNKENLEPCCIRCNRLLSDKVFNSAAEKREYIQCKLRRKRYNVKSVELPSSKPEGGRSSVQLVVDGKVGKGNTHDFREVKLIVRLKQKALLIKALQHFDIPVGHNLTVQQLYFRLRLELSVKEEQ